jgi:predicted ArsR family transcriptional regulator
VRRISDFPQIFQLRWKNPENPLRSSIVAAKPTETAPLLGHPTRARVLTSLAARGEATRVEVLAEDLSLHPNTIRLHLERLEAARFVRRETVERVGPGRPHLEWSAVAGTLPIRSAYRALCKALLRGLVASEVSPLEIRETGRGIGRDMASGREPEDAIQALGEVLTALGFNPTYDSDGRFRLESCPFRSAAEENPALVCSLHHGIIEGFTAVIDPEARITQFEPRPPVQAGCLVAVRANERREPTEIPAG